jgi:hydrophobe/amphiphile efflux-1 (HAE1) family protein
MSISTPFIRRPIGTSLLMAAIFLVGLAAYPLLPVAPLPQIEFPTISVTANYPGASPETMASTVATPLETQFAQISGVSQLTSTSVIGTSSITIQFDLSRSVDLAAIDVLEAINAATGSLPKNMPSPPSFKKVNPADSPVLILAVQSDEVPITDVDSYAENILAQQLSQLTGVSQVTVGGQQKPAIRVQVDPARLAAMGMTMEDVRGVIATATTNSPKGSIDGKTTSFTIYDNDQILSAKKFNDVVIAYRNGAPVRIRDIGRAIDGPQNQELAGWQNGKRGVQLLIFKSPGANVIDTVQSIKNKLPLLERSIPPSVHVSTIIDRTLTIRASVNDVEFTLMLSLALVVMVIFLFLRNFWATVIPSITVPLALVGTLGAMYIAGYSLDNLSLMGLTIAVGFVVDDAIVMLENIYRHIEDGMKPMDAAVLGAGEIGFTIVSISMSLIAVFIPLLLMGGIVGRLFREFAVTVSMTIVISAMVSLTLTPMMCSRFLRGEHGAHHGRLYRIVEGMFDGMLKFYERTLDIALKWHRTTLVTFIATLGLAGVLFVYIPKGFFPTQDVGVIVGISEAGQNVSFTEMSRLQQETNKVIMDDPAVQSISSTVGAGTGGQTANNGRFYINLKSWEDRPGDGVMKVIARISKNMQAVSGMRLFMQPSQDITVGGRLSRTQYQYTLQDANSDELNQWSPKLLAAMQKLPQLTSVASDQLMAGTTATLTIDRDAAARFGVQPQVIDDTLYDAFGQRYATQYFTQVSSYYVVLEVPPEMEGDLHTLDKLYVRSQSGAVVPLNELVKVDTSKVSPLAMNHQSQFPAVTLSFNLADGYALGDAVTAINNVRATAGIPDTVVGTFQGTAQAFQSSLSSEPYLIAAALVAVYIILGVLYESYILPITILSTLPAAGVGALAMLFLFHFDLSVIALIGIILLIGIVKKNGIMMVDFAINAERKDGMSPHDSIRQACLMRFRPILMTTMAALLSGLPLMTGTGAGSELRQPLGYAMVGGLAVSQILTLYTTPVVYLYLDRLQRFLSPRRHSRMPALAERMGHASPEAGD